jgi:nucleoside-diphosphate-sugar epimerase
MKILVTGGTGLLCGRLIPKLAADGHQIFALTRSASSHAELKAMGATPVDADLESGEVKRTLIECVAMSAFDPKRTSRYCRNQLLAGQHRL